MLEHLKYFFLSINSDFISYKKEFQCSILGVIFSPGYVIMFCFRFRDLLAKLPLFGFVSRIFFYAFFKIFFAIELRYGVTIDGTLILPHPQSIVIGKGSVFNGTCWIYQGVTVGTFGKHQYPKIESSVLGVNSVMLGKICVPKGSIIKAGSLNFKRTN